MFTIPIDFYGNTWTPPTWITTAGLLGIFSPGDIINIQLNVKPYLLTDTLTFSIVSGVLPTGLTMTGQGLISGTIGAPVSSSQSYSFTVHVVDENKMYPIDRTFQMNVGGKVVVVATARNNSVFQTFAGDPATTVPLNYATVFTNPSAIIGFNANFYVACNNNLLSSPGNSYWRYFTTVATVTSIVSFATDGTTLVAAGANGTSPWRAYSTDAYNWTQTDSGSVPYKRVYYVAGTSKFWLSVSANSIDQSLDGISWTAIGPTTTDLFNDVTVDPATKRMVCVTNSTTKGVWTSTDIGRTWTQLTVTGGLAVAWVTSVGLFLKSALASGQVSSSSNMTSWTIGSINGLFPRIYPVNASNIAAIFGGSSAAAGTLATTDGLNVVGVVNANAQVSQQTTSGSLAQNGCNTDLFVDPSNNRIFLCGGTATGLLIISRYDYSSLKITQAAFELLWVAITAAPTVQGQSPPLQVVCRPYWTGNEWIIPQAGLYSLDGIYWRYINSPVFSHLVQIVVTPLAGVIAFNLQYFNMIAVEQIYTAYTTTDFLNWTTTFVGGNPTYNYTPYFTDIAFKTDGTSGVVVGLNAYFGLGSSGSFTGTGGPYLQNPVQTPAPVPYNAQSVMWTGAMFVYVGGGGTIATNTNPSTLGWTARASKSTGTFVQIAATGNNVIATGTDRVVSLDGGATWSLNASNIRASDICWSAMLGKFIEVSGTVVATLTTTAGVVTSIPAVSGSIPTTPLAFLFAR